MLNNMCIDCKKLGNECSGSYNNVWTGCIYKEKGAELESIKENVKESLLGFGYAADTINSIIDDIVSLARPGVALVKEQICGEYTGKLTEMYLVAETVRNDRQPRDDLPALMMADRKRRKYHDDK